MRLNPFRKKRTHQHDYVHQAVGAGLVRQVCGRCGEVRLTRNRWPSIRWAIRNELPAIFVPLRPTMFLQTPLWVIEAEKAPPRFGERRVA